MRRLLLRVQVVLSALVIVVGGSSTVIGFGLGEVAAAPARSGEQARLIAATEVEPQKWVLSVHSPAMDREIPITVLRPADPAEPSPTLYLLNGAGDGEDPDHGNWESESRYREFFADKAVNVVTPNAGRYSYYTDWVRDDPVLGRNKWQTFLTEELPPLIDRELNTTGANAIVGISMAGTSVLNLAIAAPGLYRAAGAFSGCGRTSDPLGQAYVHAVVAERGGADIENMWGPVGGAGWRANDPYLNADQLRETKVYLTTATGVPGRYDRLDAERVGAEVLTWANQVVVGGALETVIHHCTVQVAQRLREVGAPVELRVHPGGTHSWGYWQQDLEDTWPGIAADLVAEE